jgi:hypothetical protein
MDVLYESSHGVSLSLPHPTSKKERGNKLVTILANYTSPPIDSWNNISDHFKKKKNYFLGGCFSYYNS